MLLFLGPAHLVRRAGPPDAKQDRKNSPLERACSPGSAHPGTTASIWVHVGGQGGRVRAAAIRSGQSRPSRQPRDMVRDAPAAGAMNRRPGC